MLLCGVVSSIGVAVLPRRSTSAGALPSRASPCWDASPFVMRIASSITARWRLMLRCRGVRHIQWHCLVEWCLAGRDRVFLAAPLTAGVSGLWWRCARRWQCVNRRGCAGLDGCTDRRVARVEPPVEVPISHGPRSTQTADLLGTRVAPDDSPPIGGESVAAGTRQERRANDRA